MSTLKKQYDDLVLERKELITKINELETDEKLKTYFELCHKKEQLISKEKNLYKQMKNEEYSSCNHIWVTTLHNHDAVEGRSYNYCGCIKCGLDQSIFPLIGGNRCEVDYLPLEQQIMYEFMYGGPYMYADANKKGIDTTRLCDLELGKAIYTKIKGAHPNIDDETARKYFEIALDNIRNIKVTEERKANRAKRLLLIPGFNRWTL